MKKLLPAVGIISALLSGTAYAGQKGKGVADSCAQAISDTAVNSLRGTAIILAIGLLGIYVFSNLLANRRRDRELKDLKGESAPATGIFNR